MKELDELLEAVFSAERNLKCGFDAMASADWDWILKQARAIAVREPFRELRMIINGSASPVDIDAGRNITVSLRFTTDELLRVCELLSPKPKPPVPHQG